MQKAYDRDQCGYFNPENPNDGDPAPHHNHKLDKPRRARTRRDTIFDITNDHNDKNNDNEIYAAMSKQEWEEVINRTHLIPYKHNYILWRNISIKKL